jgi:hypothetical protein
VHLLRAGIGEGLVVQGPELGNPLFQRLGKLRRIEAGLGACGEYAKHVAANRVMLHVGVGLVAQQGG